MPWADEAALEAIDQGASALSELALDLGIGESEVEDGLRRLVASGWVVPLQPVATAPMPSEWEPYLMLTSEGEEELERVSAPDS